ncbi:MAG: hypothetical protein IH614_11720 [Desulfuromonadales bacterium]|nr:hypothetical protein [Desulfuromonadales bacterium]
MTEETLQQVREFIRPHMNFDGVTAEEIQRGIDAASHAQALAQKEREPMMTRGVDMWRDIQYMEAVEKAAAVLDRFFRGIAAANDFRPLIAHRSPKEN